MYASRPPLYLVRRTSDPELDRVEPHDDLAPLARGAASGNPDAIRTLVLTIGPHLLRVVRKVLGPQHPDVDDVVQECAVAVLDALGNRRGECTVLYYACRIAALHAMKVRRRDATLKRFSIRDEGFEVDTCSSTRPAPDELLSAKLNADAVRMLLDSLPFEQAEVLTLHFVLGLTVQEMAETSQIPVETLRSRMRLAKQALRNRFAGDPRISEIAKERS